MKKINRHLEKYKKKLKRIKIFEKTFVYISDRRNDEMGRQGKTQQLSLNSIRAKINRILC